MVKELLKINALIIGIVILMRIVYVIAAVIWLIHLLRYATGNYNPDSFMIGFSMFLSMMFFISIAVHKKE